MTRDGSSGAARRNARAGGTGRFGTGRRRFHRRRLRPRLPSRLRGRAVRGTQRRTGPDAGRLGKARGFTPSPAAPPRTAGCCSSRAGRAPDVPRWPRSSSPRSPAASRTGCCAPGSPTPAERPYPRSAPRAICSPPSDPTRCPRARARTNSPRRCAPRWAGAGCCCSSTTSARPSRCSTCCPTAVTASSSPSPPGPLTGVPGRTALHRRRTRQGGGRVAAGRTAGAPHRTTVDPRSAELVAAACGDLPAALRHGRRLARRTAQALRRRRGQRCSSTTWTPIRWSAPSGWWPTR